MTTDTSATDRRITLRDGRTLCFAEYGDPDGAPMVFLHGTPASRLLGALFEPAAGEVGVRVIAPDRPGFGGSSPHPGRTFLDHAHDVADLLDALDIQRAPVAGISGGGSYVLACGVAIPDRVERGVLISGAVPMLRWSDTRGVFLLNRLIYFLGGRQPTLVEHAIRRTVARERSTGKGAHRVEATLRGLAAADQAIMARPPVRQLMTTMAAEATVNGADGLVEDVLLYSNPTPFELGDVRTPIRLLHGTEDRNVSFRLARRLAAALPDCRARYYPGDGHLFVFDRTREVLEIAMHEEVPAQTALGAAGVGG